MSLLDLPSLPGSAASSVQGSHQDDEPRGRTSDDDGLVGKEGKGNVIVSVRVRPDVSSAEKEKEKEKDDDVEWMVDGRRSLIAYRGREGGEYSYGKFRTFHID